RGGLAARGPRRRLLLFRCLVGLGLGRFLRGLLLRRRVRRICDGRRGLLDLRLADGLLLTFCSDRLVVRGRLLDGLRRRFLSWAARPAALAATAAWAPLAHRPEPFAVGSASPAALATLAQAFGATASAARLILVAE